MGKFERRVRRKNAINAVNEMKNSHPGQRFNSKTGQWEDVQHPFLKKECTLAQYQEEQIKKRLNKIGGKK